MIRGGCNCGAVTFEASSEPFGVFVCHCSICRRLTGGNGIAVVVVANDGFRWVSGEDNISTWAKPGADWQAWFCATCGSTLPGINDAERMFIPAGLISEGDQNLEVLHHIWVDSRAPWDEIGDGGKQHSEALSG